MSATDNDVRFRLRDVAKQNGCKITFGGTGREPTTEEFGQWQEFYVSNLAKDPREVGKDDLDVQDDADVTNGKPYYLVQMMNNDWKLPLMLYARSQDAEGAFAYAQYDHSTIRLFNLQSADIRDVLTVRKEDVTYSYMPVARCRNEDMGRYMHPKTISIGPLQGNEKLLVKLAARDWKTLVAPFETVSMAGNGVAIARRCLNGYKPDSSSDPRNMESMTAAADCLRELGGLPMEKRGSWREAASVVTSRVPELPRGLARPFLEETVRLFKDVNINPQRRGSADILAFLLNLAEPGKKWTVGEVLGIADRYV